MQEIFASPWFKYIAIGLGITFFVLRYFMDGYRETSDEPINFNQANDSNLTDLQKFSISLSAPISAYWNVANNTLSFTENGKKPESFDDYMEGWYINTRDGYLELKDYFLTDGRRAYFNFIYPLYKNEPRENWAAKMSKEYDGNERADRILNSFDKHNIVNYLKSERIIEFDSDMDVGSLGWDICNLVDQARRAFTAQLISEDEAWDIIGKATVMAKENFNSWREYARSQAIGFMIDMYKHKSQDDYYKDYLNIYRLTLSDPTSPWNTVAWQN